MTLDVDLVPCWSDSHRDPAVEQGRRRAGWAQRERRRQLEWESRVKAEVTMRLSLRIGSVRKEWSGDIVSEP